MGVTVVSALLIWRHRTNIRNLIAGSEGKIGSGTGMEDSGVRIQDSEKTSKS